eukprot:6178745-Pleurochrysis_carterae.AAC.1
MYITSGSEKAAERGGRVMANRSRTRAATIRERAQAQARGLGAPTGRLWVGVLAGGGGHAQAGNLELESGAQALVRKYACDANAIWETVH